MDDTDTRSLEDRARLSKRAERLLHKYIRDLASPTREEVQQLAQECEAQRSVLETQNEDLRQLQRQLERYRDRYVDLYDFAPIGYVTLDEDGFVQEVNLAGAKMLAVQRESLIGYPLADYVADQYRRAFREHVRGCAQGREEVTTELMLVARDERRIVVQLHSIPVAEDDQEPTFCKTAVTDITERKRLEESLRESEERFRAFFELAAVGAVQAEPATGRFLQVNQRFCEIVGYSREELSSKTFLDLTHPDDREDDWQRFVRLMHGEIPEYVSEKRYLRKDGEAVWVHASVTLTRDAQGNPLRSIGVVQDITERRRAEQQLKTLNDTLEQRVIQRTSQLRALASQLSQAEQQERHRLSETLHDHLQQLLIAARLKIAGLADRLPDDALRKTVAHAEELLEESIAESRSLGAELSPPILYEQGLAAGLEWLARHIGQKYGLAVETQADPKAEPAGEGVRVFLFQAVRELLLNVVEHAETNHAWVTMTLGSGSQVQIEVRDGGAGFDPASLKDREATAGGVFGLFSIRERLEALGGHLQTVAEPGKGTKMVMLAPRHPAAVADANAAAADKDAEEEATEAETEQRESASATGTTRVLLADDHRVIRKGLTELLQRWPEIEIIGEAGDGEEAVAMALRTRPDVILMDVSMPKLSGVEATRRIKKRLPWTRIVGLSMYDGNEMPAAMRDAGATDYVSKAAAPETLVAAVLGQPIP